MYPTRLRETFLPNLRANVQRGALLLDLRRSGWEKEIDTGIFDLRSCRECILGQLHDGQFGQGSYAILKIRGVNNYDMEYLAHNHGFDLRTFARMRDEHGAFVVQRHRDWDYMNSLWLEEIHRRRSAA